MSGWAAKRFWTDVSVAQGDDGYQVLLDARAVRSPAKNPLALPNRTMAEAVAAEWKSVEGGIDPAKMPITRAANSAIDKVSPQFGEVADMIAAYGATDLLCYRAENPPELCDAQAKAWDPMLGWAETTLGAPLLTTCGVVPIAQPAASLARLSDAVRATTAFQLTALYDLVSLSGSLVLGLAATRAEFEPEVLWDLSRFDEDWQAERWGRDEEAFSLTLRKREDFLLARYIWDIVTEIRK